MSEPVGQEREDPSDHLRSILGLQFNKTFIKLPK